MACLSAEQIALYVGGSASTTDAATLEQHVDTCESCRQSIAAAVRAERADDKPRGTTVGRYVVIDELGAGGMGVVFRALDPELGRLIAVKRLRPEQIGDPAQARARLAREARALAALSHPNVVTVHDIGSDGDEVFIAMELVAGTTLRRWLADAPRTIDEIVDVFRQAGRGLAAAHAMGLVHRDFKPENVLVRGDGRVQVGDFGLARAESDTDDAPASALADSPGLLVTRSGAVVGTLLYMAPEQVRGEPADARSDQFSFAVALYEALAGNRPFVATSFADLRARFATGAAAEPIAKVPSWLRAVVQRGLELDPARRYPSLDAFVDALGRDPRRARRRVLLGAGLVLGASAITAVVAVAATGDSAAGPTCTTARPRLAGVWDGARKAEIKAAFLATKKPFAADTWAATERTLDAYADAWVAAEAESCEATRAGKQSPALLDLRGACLDQRLAAIDALATVLAKADGAIAENAPRAAAQLPQLAACADKAALTATVPPPNVAIASQVGELRAKIARASALRATAKLDDAEAIAKAAVDTATTLAYAPLTAEALLIRGQIESERAQNDAAEKTLRQATDTAEAGRADEVKAEAWAQLARVATVRAQFPAAHDHASHARAVLARLGPGHDAIEARVLNYEGSAYMGEGNYAKALELQKQALAIRERIYGAESSEVATVLNSIGNITYNLSDHKGARAAHERALAIRKKVLGAHHPDVAASANNLSSVLSSMGDFAGSRALLDQALVICEEVYGRESGRAAQVRGNIAHLLATSGRYADAIVAAREALAVQQKALGPKHPYTASLHYIIGNAYVELHDPVNAKLELDRSLAIRLEVLGEAHPETLVSKHTLGRVELELKHTREAKRIFEEVLAAQEKSVGPDHLDLAQTLTLLGLAHRALRDHRGALVHFERALAIDERALGKEHGDIVIDLNTIGSTKLDLGDKQGALDTLERAVALATKLPNVEGGVRGDAYFMLAQVLWRTGGDKKRARELAETARGLYEGMGAAKAADLKNAERWLASPR